MYLIARAPFHKWKEHGMEWYQGLYTDDKCAGKTSKLKDKIEAGRYPLNLYLITLSINPQNELEILPAGELKFPYYRRNCPLIIGMARGKDRAFEVLEQIVQQVYDSTGDVRLREYFNRIK